MNLSFTFAVKNRTQRNKFWEERQACHAVPVPFHYKKGEEFLGFAPYSQPGMFGIKIFSENQAYLARSFFWTAV